MLPSARRIDLQDAMQSSQKDFEPRTPDHPDLLRGDRGFHGFFGIPASAPKVLHKLVSEQDYLVLLEANLGIGLMPESAVRSSRVTCVPLRDSTSAARWSFMPSLGGNGRRR